MVKKIDAGRIAARPGEAGDHAVPHRIFADAEGDRDGRGGGLGRKRGGVTGGSDNSHPAAGEVGHERRQSSVQAAKPVVLDSHVLALDVAGFAQGFVERGRVARGAIERTTADKADNGHGRLLRARRQRPRSRGAAEERDEGAAPCMSGKEHCEG